MFLQHFQFTSQPFAERVAAAAHPSTNLGRCFRCEENFNAIDFVMRATGRDFVGAVHFLADLLPARPSTPPTTPAN